jgi:hypothetical protein
METLEQIRKRLRAENWHFDGSYEAGQKCTLTVHPVRHVDGNIHFHYCVPCEMDSPGNTGSETFVLTEAQSESLNKYGQF